MKTIEEMFHERTVAFDPATHTYRNHDGVIRPSVTQTLAAVGLSDYSMVDPEILERARIRGTNVHKWTAEYDREGWIDEDWIAPEEHGYFDAWMRFRAESNVKIIDIEPPIIGKIAGIEVAGTPDRLCYLNGIRTVLDLKCCASEMLAWRLQLADYEMLTTGWPRCGDMVRVAVQLFRNGRYVLRYYSEESDSDAAIAALILATWDDQAQDRDADAAQRTIDVWKHNHGITMEDGHANRVA